MKGLFNSGIELMKTKNFYILVLLIVVTSLSLWCMSYPSPTFRSIMSTTQNNIRKLPKHMKIVTSPKLEVDLVYLERLGFKKEKKSSTNKSPEIVLGSALLPSSLEEVQVFLTSAHKHIPYKIILFNVGLSKSNVLIVNKSCNESTSCSIREFNYPDYPSHLQDLANKSYKPVCIQLLLQEFGAVIWADTNQYISTSNINNSIIQARDVGLVAWTIDDATSSLTHPKMFEYFKTKNEKYYFHHAVRSSHIILYNNKKIHNHVMLPWVKCALVEECINPTGAQNSGCNYHRKPKFLYSGCHWYDMSALNVILGKEFDFDVDLYSGKDAIFRTKFDDEKEAGANVTGTTRKTNFLHRVYI